MVLNKDVEELEKNYVDLLINNKKRLEDKLRLQLLYNYYGISLNSNFELIDTDKLISNINSHNFVIGVFNLDFKETLKYFLDVMDLDKNITLKDLLNSFDFHIGNNVNYYINGEIHKKNIYHHMTYNFDFFSKEKLDIFNEYLILAKSLYEQRNERFSSNEEYLFYCDKMLSLGKLGRFFWRNYYDFKSNFKKFVP